MSYGLESPLGSHLRQSWASTSFSSQLSTPSVPSGPYWQDTPALPALALLQSYSFFTSASVNESTFNPQGPFSSFQGSPGRKRSPSSDASIVCLYFLGSSCCSEQCLGLAAKHWGLSFSSSIHCVGDFKSRRSLTWKWKWMWWWFLSQRDCPVCWMG